jgi:hypothetical protein
LPDDVADALTVLRIVETLVHFLGEQSPRRPIVVPFTDEKSASP